MAELFADPFADEGGENDGGGTGGDAAGGRRRGRVTPAVRGRRLRRSGFGLRSARPGPRPRRERPPMIGFPKWLAAGLVAASVGGAVWVGLSYFLNVEVGFLAWGIGFLAGVGVRWAAGESDGFLPGAAAVIAAIAVVAFSKYMAVSLAVNAMLGGFVADEPPDYARDRDAALVKYADTLIEARNPDAIDPDLQWPPGQSYETAYLPEHYPPRLMELAGEKWGRHGRRDPGGADPRLERADRPRRHQTGDVRRPVRDFRPALVRPRGVHGRSGWAAGRSATTEPRTPAAGGRLPRRPTPPRAARMPSAALLDRPRPRAAAGDPLPGEVRDADPQRPFTAGEIPGLLDRLGGIDPGRVWMTPAPGTATAEDAEFFHDRGYSVELIDGTLVEKAMSDWTRLSRAGDRGPAAELREGPAGWASATGPAGSSTSAGTFAGRTHHSPRNPAAADRCCGGGYSDVPPALVVEVISPRNARAEMARKRETYFTHDVRLVWEFDGDAAGPLVRIYEGPDEPAATLRGGDTLTGRAVLPGFRAAVDELFADPLADGAAEPDGAPAESSPPATE